MLGAGDVQSGDWVHNENMRGPIREASQRGGSPAFSFTPISPTNSTTGMLERGLQRFDVG
jgi:hypothetical protein